ncbi:DHS-like NAD/FAD-binding domain-containing protein [Chytriomyces cf. hyalinus JEL632]|nr:DHS-like NAD/FAD-binding domain-containing protein [Chytriomyces cf. hyalinus JEL632]
MRDSQKYPQSKAKRRKNETLPHTGDAPKEEGLDQVLQIADSTKREEVCFDAAVDLFRRSKRIIIVTGKEAMSVFCFRLTIPLGAGISTNAGIPDFRSENGIYSRLDEFKLDTPEDIFHIDFFKCNPQPFYTFSKVSYVSHILPTLCHEFVKLLETKKKLLRNYTQNIDGLEKHAGVTRLLQVHGSFSTARCTACRYKAAFEVIKPFLETGKVMYCPKCFERKEGIVKPDIVFFGEKYSSAYDKLIAKDKAQADLIVVMGSSLKIFPIAGILGNFMSEVPAILINKETLDAKLKFDHVLKGDSDTIVSEICRRLGWDLISPLLMPAVIKERDGGLVEFVV